MSEAEIIKLIATVSSTLLAGAGGVIRYLFLEMKRRDEVAATKAQELNDRMIGTVEKMLVNQQTHNRSIDDVVKALAARGEQ